MDEEQIRSIVELGSAEAKGKKASIHCLTIVGQIVFMDTARI